MKSQSGEYNLKIVLATYQGTCLARLPVCIRNTQGKKILEIETNSPRLYTRLPDGKYTIQSSYEGSKKERTVKVDDGLELVILNWKN
jgi:hypothetical protein